MIHTPGRWTQQYDADGDHAIFANNKLVAVTTGIPDVPHEEDAANARLIASAPELYEALEYLVEHACPESYPAGGMWSRAKKALAKAEGR